ncbi:MAG: hypothetical protein KDD69_15155 [Bdellovibrionales bacterium]|nr:hypothetical protein [Bdellovibrionales bacterium]
MRRTSMKIGWREGLLIASVVIFSSPWSAVAQSSENDELVSGLICDEIAQISLICHRGARSGGCPRESYAERLQGFMRERLELTENSTAWDDIHRLAARACQASCARQWAGKEPRSREEVCVRQGLRPDRHRPPEKPNQ